MKRTLIVGGAILVVIGLWVATIAIAVAVAKFRVPINLDPFLYVGGFDGYFRAKGTWVIEGHKQAFPLQTTSIECKKEHMACTSATAQVMFGDQLNVHLDSYPVIEWGRGHVVFTDDSPACVRYVYTLDVRTKSVIGVRVKRPKAPAECKDMVDELRLALKGGLDVVNGLEKDAFPWYGTAAIAPLKALFH